jgi:hypothetical protein
MPFNTAEEKLRGWFDELSKEQKQAFYAKLMYACDKDDWALFYANDIVNGARKKGTFDRIKFGDEIAPEPLGIINPS